MLRVNRNRSSLSVISTVNNKGQMRWKIFSGALNAKILIGFLERLTRHERRKLFLILDNLRVHHSQVVKQWLKANADKIEVFYLPSYSPELNPDELLKCRPEAKGHHNCPGKNENGPDKDRILFAPQYPEAAATGAALLPPSACQVRRMSMTISDRSNSINPGDLVFGDLDGIVIVPPAVEEEVIVRSLEKARAEKLVRKEIEAGSSSTEVFAKYGIL